MHNTKGSSKDWLLRELSACGELAKYVKCNIATINTRESTSAVPLSLWKDTLGNDDDACDGAAVAAAAVAGFVETACGLSLAQTAPACDSPIPIAVMLSQSRP